MQALDLRGYPGEPTNDKMMTVSILYHMFYTARMKDAVISGDINFCPFANNPGQYASGR
jgi:hypothetical protein